MGAVQQACCGNFRNQVQKIIKGILVINIHQTQPGVPLKKFEDKHVLHPIIKQSLIQLQEKSNIFIPHTQQLSPEEIDKIHKGEGGICGGKYKINSKNNTISPQNIEFTKFRVNTTNYPYIVYFELTVDMLEGDHIFCENLEKQNYEIFNDTEKLGEVSYISSFWFVGEKNFQNQNQQTNKQNPENFITDAEEQQSLANNNNLAQQQQQQQIHQNLTPNDKNLQQQFNQIPETFEEDGIPTLEITLPYFQQNFKKVLNIYESESIALDLFYDQEKDKLFSVKIFKNQFSHIDSTNILIENEKKRVIKAIRDSHLPLQERFMDKFDDEIRTLKRNIVREIMISYLCNDFELKGINKLEGVIVGDKNIMIAYDFFGDSELQSKQLTCDLGSYFSKNVQSYFQHKNYDETFKILQDILFSIITVVDELHQQGVFMRELQPQDILVRRRFNPVQPSQSIYEVCLVNFGKSKRIPIDQNDPYNKNSQKQLKNEHSVKLLNKPQQLFGKDSNQNKNFIDFKRDDTFQLGILLYKLFLILGLEQQIDQQTKDNLQRMTGLPFSLMTEFYEIMSKVKQLFKGGLEEAMKYEENIKDLQEIKEKWNKNIGNSQISQDKLKQSQQMQQQQSQFQQQQELLSQELQN